MKFNEAKFKEILSENKIVLNKVTFSQNDNYVKGGGQLIVVASSLQIYTSASGYPNVCSSGMLFSYSVQKWYAPETSYSERTGKFTEDDRKQARIIIDAMLSTMGQDSYPNVGGWVAVNPMETIYDEHFLVLGGFVPLMGWANSYHGDRGTMVWLKQMDIPNEDNRKTITQDQLTTLYKYKRTALSLLPLERVEVKRREKSFTPEYNGTPIPVTKVIDSSTVARPRDEQGRFVNKPVYNTEINKTIKG